jgi:hypothetical protein
MLQVLRYSLGALFQASFPVICFKYTNKDIAVTPWVSNRAQLLACLAEALLRQKDVTGRDSPGLLPLSSHLELGCSELLATVT